MSSSSRERRLELHSFNPHGFSFLRLVTDGFLYQQSSSSSDVEESSSDPGPAALLTGLGLGGLHPRHGPLELGGEAGSSVVVAAWFWSDLWKDCYQDSTALVNCVDFGVLWTVKSYVQAVRGLLVIGLCLGSIGTVLAFLGLECTRVGGGQRSKDGLLVTASAFHLAGCLSDVAGYCLYINRVVVAFLHSKADPSALRYEMGAPLYVGLVGSLLLFLGCAVHCATVYRGNQTESRRHAVPSIRGKQQIRGRTNWFHDNEASVVMV
ncbi:claudin-10 [Scophthalmus maximus]|uniref:claudin-10 n=1 Tax=Scophthalmus maximus TaxID=52904 RepID=UPI0015E0EFB5|nr:claudin-10 [Scophthalmus maximus]